jgi:uncharacterized protein (TIGR00369 family)
MKKKILHKQYISEMCFCCGINNDLGLKAEFYELEDGQVVAIFDPKEAYQSYPQRLHGGISATILDETLGRAILVLEPDTWGVTAELNLRYKKPVPLGQPLRVLGRVTKNSHRLFIASGEIILPNGEIAVTAEGKYVKLDLNKITDLDSVDGQSFMLQADLDRFDIELDESF